MPESVNAMRVVHVFDDRGVPWRRWEQISDPPPAPTGFAESPAIWRAWGTEIILGTPAPRNGLWRMEHYANRADPIDDVSELDISLGDEDLILALALAVRPPPPGRCRRQTLQRALRGASDGGSRPHGPGRRRSPALAPFPARAQRLAHQHPGLTIAPCLNRIIAGGFRP